MKRFLIRVALFLIICLGVFEALDRMITTGLKKTRQETYDVWNDIFSGKINAELLISGSSRAWVHVSPVIMDTVLATNSYNIGFDGTSFEDQYKRYKIYRKYNSKPKCIIQVLDINSFAPRAVLTRHQQLLPYLDDPAVKDMALKYSGFTWFMNCIPFYKYIGQTNYIKIGLLEFLNVKSYLSLKYKGYEAKSDTWRSEDEDAIADQVKEVKILADPRIERLYAKFIQECAEEEIKVVSVLAPEYIEFQREIADRHQIIEKYRNLTSKYGNQFIDFSSDSMCYRKELFYNSTHMNKNGAEQFSVQLSDSIKLSWKQFAQ